MGKGVNTDFLFAQPSVASGIARVVDMWGTFDDYNSSNTGSEADAKAIAADWLMVGQDIAEALDEYSSLEEVA
jgi:hypothetical protein